ncbi:hypothetical protein ACVXG9_00100 [Escherichia coli]
MLMRRGCRVHYCFFNLGGAAHELACVRWRIICGTVLAAPTACVLSLLISNRSSGNSQKIDDGQMGVILKRMMVRAASKVAERYGVQALVTGEALGQGPVRR